MCSTCSLLRRAGSEDTTTYEPQSMLPWPDHAPHGCSHPGQCKTDSGPDARGLKQPPDQPEVRVDLSCICNMDEDELMLRACLRAEQLLQNLAAVSGKPGLDAITEDQLIQASAMCHCSITQELKGGLITDRAAKAARKVAVQLRFSIPCAAGDTQAPCHLHASQIWSPSNFSPSGPRSSRPLVHRRGHALAWRVRLINARISSAGKRPTCRQATKGRGHWHGDSVASVASMSGGQTQAPTDGAPVHRSMRSRGFKICLPASGPRPGTLAAGKDQISSPARTTCFLASEIACTNQQRLSRCILFLSSPKQVCAPSTQMREAQEAEDEGASPRPRRYPRSRYRPDGARRRTAGELRARGARNQWPRSASQNRKEPTIGPGNTGLGSPPTGATVAAGPTTLDGQTPPGIGSRLEDRDAAYPETVMRTETPRSSSQQPSQSQHAVEATTATRTTAEETPKSGAQTKV